MMSCFAEQIRGGISPIDEAMTAIEVSLQVIKQLRATMMDYVLMESNVSESPRIERLCTTILMKQTVNPMLVQLVETHGQGCVAAVCDIEPAAELCQVDADPAWLVDMLLNLIGNAVKFTRKGHVAVSVSHSPPKSGGKCVIEACDAGRDTSGVGYTLEDANNTTKDELIFSVEDTGPGVPEAAAGRLFVAFQQVEGTIGGHGLGLASVKRKVRAHIACGLMAYSLPG